LRESRTWTTNRPLEHPKEEKPHKRRNEKQTSRTSVLESIGLAVRAAGLAQREGDTEMCKRMNANNHANTANVASLMNACRFLAALFLVFVALMALPAFAERPDIVWMSGGHAGGVNSVAFSPDGSMIASGGGYDVTGKLDKTIKLWRVSDGKLLRTLEGHTWEVHSVAFSPDGSMIASGSEDETIKLWRVSDGALLRTLWGGSSLGM
jgi:hypothetical protein